MKNTDTCKVCEELNRRAFDRAWVWATNEIFSPVWELVEQKRVGEAGRISQSEMHALMDSAFEAAKSSGELDELLDPDNEIYTRAFNREEAEFMFHFLAARSDDVSDELDAHYEFLVPFGITPENIDDKEGEEAMAE